MKIFSQVSTHQGPILKLVYPWYINTEHNGKKDKVHLYTKKHLMYIMYIQCIYKYYWEEFTNVSQQLEICPLFLEQVVCRMGTQTEQRLLEDDGQ